MKNLPIYLPKIDPTRMLLGNQIFMMAGAVLIVIGLLLLFIKRNDIQKMRRRFAYGFIIVGILSFLNNFVQYTFIH